MTNRIYLFSAALVLAGCSSSAQEAPNTAIVVQSGPELAGSFDAMPPEELLLDGVPPVMPAPVEPAPLVAPAEYRAPPPPVAPKRVQAGFSCEIDVYRTSNGIRVTPIVRAGKSLSGEYSLVITKSGAGGSSDISQGGPFDAARGERVKLSASEFSMERGAKFRAVLKVRADGREVCRDITS
jgi:hypothetical protein